MVNLGDDRIGTPAEFELRDDDGSGATSYRRGRRSGLGLVLVLGLIVTAALLAFLSQDRLPGASVPASVVRGAP